MNSIKFNLNQFIAIIFIVLGLGMLVFAVKIGSSSFSESLVIDESAASAQGMVLQKMAIGKAIQIIEKSNFKGNIEGSGSGNLRKEDESIKEVIYPKKVEIVSNDLSLPIIEEVKAILKGEETEFSVREDKEGLDENRVIYKNEYSDLKIELVNFLENKDLEVTVLKRQEEKEFDMTVELVNNDISS